MIAISYIGLLMVFLPFFRVIRLSEHGCSVTWLLRKEEYKWEDVKVKRRDFFIGLIDKEKSRRRSQTEPKV